MSTKLIVFFEIVAVCSAAIPYIGFPLPFYDKYNYGLADAEKNSFPYVVSLQWGDYYTNQSHFCGGAILNSLWVITSAHCASVVPPYGNFVVKTGKHDLSIKESTEQTITVEKTIIHEKFKGDVGYYDAALLKLSKPITMNNVTKAISLTTKSPTGGSGMLLSWGSNWRMHKPNMPNVLQRRGVTLIANKTNCQRMMSDITGTNLVIPGSWQFCGASETFGVFTTCDAEPGAPLTANIGSGGPYLLGLVTWGVVPCGVTGAPLVFEDMAYFGDWVKSVQSSN